MLTKRLVTWGESVILFSLKPYHSGSSQGNSRILKIKLLYYIIYKEIFKSDNTIGLKILVSFKDIKLLHEIKINLLKL